jgi:ABC-type nitrate/sulfonate/bicarbonate transport system permease component
VGLKAIYRRSEAVILGAVGLIAFFILWEAIARMELLNPVLISSPSRVAVALNSWATSGALWRDLTTSLLELAIAFVAAALVGIPLGVVMGLSRWAEYALDPFIWGLYSSPTVSLWPLFIIWFGIGIQSIIILAFLFAVVQVAINTFAGLRGIDPLLIRCARSFNASRKDLFFKFILPGAFPMIIAGLRLAVGRALIGVIIGELFCSNSGLGYHISYYGAKLRFDDFFASLLVVVLVGIFLTQLIRVVEVRSSRWNA